MLQAAFRFDRRTLAAVALLAGAAAPSFADTSAFTIVDDAAMNSAVANVRSQFLATRTFDRLSATILVRQQDGTWKRGSYEADRIEYPASCVKLAYLAAAMRWCAQNGRPYDYLDASVRPMIEVSDNVATGEVVDAITGAPNVTNPNKPGTISFNDWYAKRRYTENFLTSRGLLDNQTVLHKTYPTNSGSSPTGYEADAQTLRGGNRMQPKLSASLMLEIQKGAIEPGANAYMRGLLTHERFGGDSSIGFGMPPGATFENKIGIAYDTLEDIAYVKMPNGKEFILAAYTNGWNTAEPYPYDGAPLGLFAEMLVENLGLDAGNPAKIKIDNGGAGYSTTGAWTTATAQIDKFGSSYAYASGGSGATATFALNVPATGKYEVCAWWADGTNRATNAPFTVNHAAGATTTNLDQTARGGCWVKLGDYDFNAGTGTVVLGTSGVSASSLVVADAIKATLWPSGGGAIDPIPGTDVIVQNEATSAYYAETGSWTTGAGTGYNGTSYRYATVGAAATAAWTAELTEAGTYDVFAWYTAGTNRTTAARYTVGGQNFTLNQQAGGSAWTKIGTVSLSSGLNTVTLNAGASTGGTVVVADTVRFTKTVPVATTCRVSAIALSTVNAGGGKKQGRAIVTIVDNLGAPVANSTVTGAFTGSYNETKSAATNASGQATITTTAKISGTPAFTFCVSSVTHGTLTYTPAANNVTCSTF